MAEINIKDISSVTITATFGIAVLDNNTFCDDSKKLVDLAKKALLKAKQKGYNRTCLLKYE